MASRGLFDHPYVVPVDEPREATPRDLLGELAEAAERLPAEGPPTASRGAEPFAAFVDTLGSLYRLCEQCIAEYTAAAEAARRGAPHAECAPFVDHRGRRLRPWRTHSHATWLRLHEQLWQLVLRNGEQLRHEVPAEGRAYRLADLCFGLLCQLLQCCHLRATPDMIRAYHAYLPPAAIAELLLDRRSTSAPVEINRFSMTTLLDHLYHLQSSWNELVYSAELRHYLGLLEVRASFLVTCAHSELAHDADAFRRDGSPPRAGELAADAMVRERYHCSLEALALLRALFEGFRERLYWGAALAPAPDAYAALPFPYNLCYGAGATDDERRAAREREARFRAAVRWVQGGLRPAGECIPSGFLKRALPDEALWPGERGVYDITNRRDAANASSVAPLSIIRRFRAASGGLAVNPLLMLKRGADYEAIVRQSETPTDDALREGLAALPADAPAGREDALLRLALHEHISHRIDRFFTARRQRLAWDTYAVMSAHLPLRFHGLAQQPVTQAQIDALRASGASSHAELADYRAYPCLAQLMNHWSIAYRGHVYWLNSYLESFCVWLRIVEAHHGGHVESLDVRPLIDSVFGGSDRRAGQDAPAPQGASRFAAYYMD